MERARLVRGNDDWFPTRTLFKLKMMCKGFTSRSFAFANKRKLKLLKSSSYKVVTPYLPHQF
jgi:hypothetical protein